MRSPRSTRRSSRRRGVRFGTVTPVCRIRSTAGSIWSRRSLSLVLLRLEQAGAPGREPSAYLTELFVQDMDGQLRERGIGDIIVGKHIGRMMAALGGRLGALRDAFAGGDLDDAIARNIFRGAPPMPEATAAVRDGLIALRGRLDAMPLKMLTAGEWSA